MKAKLMGIISLLCSLFACNAQTNDFKSLSVEEYAKAIEDSMVVRLDVRTPEEYAEGHIEGAVLADVKMDNFLEVAQSKLSKDSR